MHGWRRWILGHLVNGAQADFARVPSADTSTYAIPAGASDEKVLMLADILPTGYEVGVLNGQVRPGDVVGEAMGPACGIDQLEDRRR